MKNLISISLMTIFILVIFISGVILGEQQSPTTEQIVREALDEMKILDGSSLRAMMNEAKYSPGRAIDYAIDYPTYAYLFDGSFITYVDN